MMHLGVILQIQGVTPNEPQVWPKQGCPYQGLPQNRSDLTACCSVGFSNWLARVWHLPNATSSRPKDEGQEQHNCLPSRIPWDLLTLHRWAEVTNENAWWRIYPAWPPPACSQTFCMGSYLQVWPLTNSLLASEKSAWGGRACLVLNRGYGLPQWFESEE